MTSTEPQHPLASPEYHRNRSLFLDDWQTLVQTEIEGARVNVGHAVTYGSTALQAAYLLNGGALAALPALVTALTPAGKDQIALAAIPFVLGIAAAAISSLFAYLNFQWHAEVKMHDSQVNGAMLGTFYSKAGIAPDPKERTRLETKIQRSFYVGLAAGVASLVLFVIGAMDFIGLAASHPR